MSPDNKNVADYWNARPCNVRHSTKPMSSSAYAHETEARKYFVEPHIPPFADFPRWHNKQVLEIGCGIGIAAINFAQWGARVTAVDISSESIAVARLRAEALGVDDRITFLCADAENLSQHLAPMPYDLVYAWGSLHHTTKPEQIVSQVWQHYTAPGSLFKVMVYHRHSYKVAMLLLTHFWKILEGVDSVVSAGSEAQTNCPVTKSYTRDSARRLLSGFNVTDMQVEHIFPYSVPAYRRHMYVKKWLFKPIPTNLFRRLERHFGWHLCINATR
jgi:2-polyprenyl-3-methyl-5-hydroxy-6-metoxy-1,4-benzoquinol methylase